MAIKTWAGLTKEINRRINISLAEDVYPIVKDKMLEHIESDVKSQGRGSDGGLGDEKNIVIDGEIKKGLLHVINVAVADKSLLSPSKYPFKPAKRTTFARWINEKEDGFAVGGWMDYYKFIKTGNKVMRASRPFMTNTQMEIKSNPKEILNALKRGIEGRK